MRLCTDHLVTWWPPQRRVKRAAGCKRRGLHDKHTACYGKQGACVQPGRARGVAVPQKPACGQGQCQELSTICHPQALSVTLNDRDGQSSF